MFQCRQLGERVAVLAEDNTIMCCDDSYRAAWWLALLLFALVPVGVPGAIVVWMITNYRTNQSTHAQQQQQQPPAAAVAAEEELGREEIGTPFEHLRSRGCFGPSDRMPEGHELDFIAHLRGELD